MFDFKKIRISPLTKEWILERVSDSEVFMHYYGKFQSKLRNGRTFKFHKLNK